MSDEHLLRAFSDYVEAQTGSATEAGKAKEIIGDYLHYLRRVHGSQYRENRFQLFGNATIVIEFIASEFNQYALSTQRKARDTVLDFQRFVRERNWVARQVDRLLYIGEKPVSRLIAIVISVIGGLGALLAIMEYIIQLISGVSPSLPAATVPPTISPAQTSVTQLAPTATATMPFAEMPTISAVIEGWDLAGYGKQTAAVRNSRGVMTVFVRNTDGRLAFIQSQDDGVSWSDPIVFDTVTPEPLVSAAIDRSDDIHLVWGRVPQAGDVKYALLRGDIFLAQRVLASGVFARDITVDSVNRPHVVWTTVNLAYSWYDGTRWKPADFIGQGFWHPDIQIDADDNVHIFANDASTYPAPWVGVHAFSDAVGAWQPPTRISQSTFWSGGVAAAIDQDGTIYVVWFGASSTEGGSDTLFFAQYTDGQWTPPVEFDEVNGTTGTTGQESPAIAIDKNNVIYVVWRGQNRRGRTVIFVRPFVPSNSPLLNVTPGWGPRITLDDRSTVSVGWPTVADTRPHYRESGIDIFWPGGNGHAAIIDYAHVYYPPVQVVSPESK